MNDHAIRQKLARRIADDFGILSNVSAVALGGSTASLTSGPGSDIDLYVFTTSLIPLATRKNIIYRRGSTKTNLNLDYWDLGDEWFDESTAIEVDVMYWDTHWIEAQIDRTLVHHQPSLGYSTCHWHTIMNAVLLYDCEGWFASLQARCNLPYPQALQDAILARNFPVLRDVIPAYINQIEKAIIRNDLVSINHRIAAFLASYFDILFALNRIPHPGEKHLLEHAKTFCSQLPNQMELKIIRTLSIASQGNLELLDCLNAIVDDLQDLLEQNQIRLP